MKCYLAGPVSHLTYDQALGWRRKLARRLKRHDIECLLPLVREKALRGKTKLDPMGHPDVHGCDGASVYYADLQLLHESDVLLANLLGAKRISLGTVWELGWAVGHMKGRLVVMGRKNPHQHLFIHQSCRVVETLDEAVEILREWNSHE